MNWKLLFWVKKILKKGARRPKHEVEAQRLFDKEKYLEAYSLHTDMRVESDPQLAVGGMWEEVGNLQFDFLVRKGLKPHHRLLDIGCGTLRGGRHFVRYLDAGHYTGMDISPKALEYGRQLMEREHLSGKRPNLVLSQRKDLRFEEFKGEVFDYLLAQSVFTHLPAVYIEECFQYVGRIMDPASMFFFTYKDSARPEQSNLKTFRYPWSFFEALAGKYGLNLTNYSNDYRHPKSQRMAMVSPAAPRSPGR